MVIVLTAIYQNGNLKNTQSLMVLVAGIGTDKYAPFASRTMKEACKINVSRYLENNARDLKKC